MKLVSGVIGDIDNTIPQSTQIYEDWEEKEVKYKIVNGKLVKDLDNNQEIKEPKETE
jgi:hypothetical protein